MPPPKTDAEERRADRRVVAGDRDVRQRDGLHRLEIRAAAKRDRAADGGDAGRVVAERAAGHLEALRPATY